MTGSPELRAGPRSRGIGLIDSCRGAIESGTHASKELGRDLVEVANDAGAEQRPTFCWRHAIQLGCCPHPSVHARSITTGSDSDGQARAQS